MLLSTWTLYVFLCVGPGARDCVTKAIGGFRTQAACEIAAGQWQSDPRYIRSWCE